MKDPNDVELCQNCQKEATLDDFGILLCDDCQKLPQFKEAIARAIARDCARGWCVLACALMLSCVGCKSVDRLLNGPDPEPTSVQAIGGPALIGGAPDFNVPTPAGYAKTVYNGALPIDGIVAVTPAPDSLVDVFMRQRNIGQWLKLDDQFSGAFWYSYDPAAGRVVYRGDHLELIEFCVYQYVPI